MAGQEPFKVNYKVLPENAQAEKVELKVEDEAVAKIDGDSVVPVAEGETTLTITVDGVETTVAIQVEATGEVGSDKDASDSKNEPTTSKGETSKGGADNTPRVGLKYFYKMLLTFV